MTMERIEGRNFEPGEIIFREDDPGREAYVLVSGRVRISKRSKVTAGRKLELAELTPFAIFGEMALYLEDATRTATATAVETTRTMVLEKDNFEDFMRQSPQILGKVIEDLAHRIHDATTSRQPPSMVHSAALLLQMLAANGLNSVKLDSFLDMLASMYGQNPETVRRALQELADHGYFVLDEEAGVLTFDPDAGRRILAD